MTATTFKTDDGQTWTIRLTIGDVDRINEHVGVDLYDQDDFEKIITKPRIAIACVGAALIPEIEKRGSTIAKFRDTLDADACFAAIDAFTEAFANFCPAETRETRRQILGRMKEARIVLEARMLKKAETEIAKAMDQLENESAETSGEPLAT